MVRRMGHLAPSIDRDSENIYGEIGLMRAVVFPIFSTAWEYGVKRAVGYGGVFIITQYRSGFGEIYLVK